MKLYDTFDVIFFGNIAHYYILSLSTFTR